MSRHSLSTVVLAVLVAAGSTASADLSRGVISAFRGQLVVSKDELPEGKNDADTIKKIKAAQVKELTGTTNEDVTYWHFHYTAFLTKTGSTKLTLEFLKEGNKLSANQSLDSIDPKNSVLSGDISINEDEGLAKGKTYTVQLVTSNDTVVAKTTLTMK
jgi:hypothetical protein